MNSVFSRPELDYLNAQHLGRLATVRADGSVQNNPVGFFIDGATIVIGGRALAGTHKFANVRHNGYVSLVVDDLASADPWAVRGIEIRGRAVTEEDVDPPVPYMSRDLIRIHPERIVAWGLGEGDGMNGRNVNIDRTAS